MPFEGTCKLCQKYGDLCNSHIVPEWGYAGVYDSKHRFRSYEWIGKEYPKVEQKGYREHLLCRHCETLLSKWEAYGKSVWRLEVGKWYQCENDVRVGKGIDYKKLRLFLLSLLWRFDAASHPFTVNVALGPHGECIRRALMSRNPLEQNRYPCIMTRIMEEGKWNQVGVRGPIKGRWYGQRAYSVAFKGIGLLYVIGHRALKDREKFACISAAGNIRMGLSEARTWKGHMNRLELQF